jgi:hypothetical protein
MRHAFLSLCAACAIALSSSAALAGEKAEADRDFPPRVVKTEPAIGEKDVDPALKEIKVTYDRPMTQGQNYSWIIHKDLGDYPGTKGGPEPRWENDGKTCVLAVKLRPDTVYAVGVNSVRHFGFKDADGKVAVPYVWVFKTKQAK